jgi:predicted KAP-like P-loop ATPase
MQQATLSVVLFAAATFILWIPKIVVATREYKSEFLRVQNCFIGRENVEWNTRKKRTDKAKIETFHHKTETLFFCVLFLLKTFPFSSRFTNAPRSAPVS